MPKRAKETRSATFATRCLWKGIDIRTVQQWLGHVDMESTMRYLKPSRSEGTNEKVNAIFASGQPRSLIGPCYEKRMVFVSEVIESRVSGGCWRSK